MAPSIISSIRTKVAKAILPGPYYQYPKYNPSPSALLGSGQTLGRSGLRYFFPGWIRNEQLADLQGRRKYLVYREMGDMNGYCASVLNAFAMFLRRSAWDVDPIVDENKDNGSYDFLKSCMDDMEHSWKTFMAIASRTAPQMGFAPFEIIYKRRSGENDDYRYSSKFDDNRISWQNFSIRSPETILHWVWYPDDPTKLQGFVQITPPDYPPNLFIPIEKVLLLRAEPDVDNPEGRSVLRSSFKPFVTIKYLEDSRNVIIEHAGTGIPYADVPPNISEPYQRDHDGEIVLDDEGNPKVDANALRTLNGIIAVLKNIRIGSQPYVIRPQQYDEKGNKLYDMGFITNNGGAMIADINTTIHDEGLKILMSTMTEFLALGTNSTGGGSLALSRAKTDNFTLAITSYLDAFEESINNQAVRRLFRLNPEFDNLEILPRIVHAPIIPIDVKDVIAVLTSFKGLGWNPAEEANAEDIKGAVFSAMGLPKPAKKHAQGSTDEEKQEKPEPSTEGESNKVEAVVD